MSFDPRSFRILTHEKLFELNYTSWMRSSPVKQGSYAGEVFGFRDFKGML